MERLLITGANGLLGQKCIEQFKSKYEVYGFDIQEEAFLAEKKLAYQQIDITNRNALKKAITAIEPQYIINTAAYTDVDGSESNKEICWKINVDGVQNLVSSANKVGAKIIHLSSDYIFDGNNGPYRETDPPKPLGFYGKSKLAGENVLLQSDLDFAIVRTMVLYGAGINVRHNFATWLIRKLKDGENVTIVTDQIGNPTLVNDLANGIHSIIELQKWETFHISGDEILDRYTFALKIANTFRLNHELIQPITTTDLKQTAPRPLNSGFILEKAKKELNLHMLNVDDSLKILKKQLKKLKFI